MQIQDLIKFQEILNESMPVDSEIALNKTKGDFASIVSEMKQNPIKVLLISTIDNYIKKGWDSLLILGETRVKNRYTLLMCMDHDDKIAEIEEDYIKIIKATGESQYYEKDLLKSKNRESNRK